MTPKNEPKLSPTEQVLMVLDTLHTKRSLAGKTNFTLPLKRIMDDAKLSIDDAVDLLKRLEEKDKVLVVNALTIYNPMRYGVNGPIPFTMTDTYTLSASFLWGNHYMHSPNPDDLVEITLKEKEFDQLRDRKRDTTNSLTETQKLIKKIEQDIAQEVEQKQRTADIAYQISYSNQTREIILNGFLLAKPDFGSENEQFFTYIFAHPNQKLNRIGIEKETGNLKKTLHQIIRDLGFKGELARLFFSVSKTHIQFNNPITKKTLSEAGIPALRFHQKESGNSEK